MEETLDHKALEDAYLNRRIRTRKISFLVISIVTFLVALTFILMACLDYDNQPRFISQPSRVEVYSLELASGSRRYNNGEENYKEFQAAYNNMFQLKFLNAVFTGNFGEYEINETHYGFPDQTSTSALQNEFKSSNFVKLVFDEPQQLYNKNGSLYQDGHSALSTNKDLTFRTVYFTFDEENVKKDVTFYFAVEGNLSYPSITTLTVKANTSSIYKLVEKYK